MSRSRILVVCEKPTAASRIAQALDDHNSPETYREKGVSYHLARNGRNDLIIVSALGHLYSIRQSKGKWTYPIFDTKWVPAYVANKKLSRTKPFIEIIKKLSKNLQGHISACDYDLEGSLIAYMIIQDICTDTELKKTRRMKFSTLTDQDIRTSYKTAKGLDFSLIDAGKSRHEIDWLYGINLSRALTLSVRNAAGLYRTLSIGRVQGPTVSYIQKREIEIQTFVPIPYYDITAKTRIDKKLYTLEYEKPHLDTLRDVERIVNICKGNEGTIKKVVAHTIQQSPPPPFNLGDLQQEAYRKFKYNLRTTQTAAEKLYLSAYISYPRTSSQRIPSSIDIKSILRNLAKKQEYHKHASELLSKKKYIPIKGKKDDPAHPAIHPTGKLPGKLSKNEAKIYDLIVRRFISSMGDPAVRENVNAHVEVKGYLFYLKGKTIRVKGWMKYYEDYVKEKETPLPSLQEGMKLPVTKIKADQKTSKPPNRYNQSSLLKLMEDRKLGTKATRTDIIDTLFKREYVIGNPIKITNLGFKIVETLNQYLPSILSTELTRELEENIEDIQRGKIKGKAVVEKSILLLEPVLRNFKEKEKQIGIKLGEALRKEVPKGEILGTCPTCNTGVITIIQNRQTGKRFAGCSNYYSGCKQSYPLPQKGLVKPLNKYCPGCEAPLVQIINRGKNPWEICINMKCPLKEVIKAE